MDDCITIDREKCIGCNTCVKECPAHLITVVEKKAELRRPEFCISCGHCAIVCPVNAIRSAETNKKHPFTVADIDFTYPDDVLLFHKKRSVRSLSEQEIPRADMDTLIEYAEKAPSAHNGRGRGYIVVQGRDKVQKLRISILDAYERMVKKLNPLVMTGAYIFNRKAYYRLKGTRDSFLYLINECRKGNDRIFRNARCVVCITAPSSNLFSRDDCIAAQHYMMLYGETQGIKSFIVGYAQWVHEALEKFFELEEGTSIFAVTVFGYSSHGYTKEVIYEKPKVLYY